MKNNTDNFWHNLMLNQKFEHPRKLPEIINIENMIDFCTNDYLGVNTIQELKHNINNYLTDLLQNDNVNIGATGSRLLSGNTYSHLKLEQLIAKTKGSESALIFNSGYQTNYTVMTALLKNLDKNKIKIFSDKANHASLHHAFQNLNLKQIRYAHNNLEHLDQRLKAYAQADNYIFIITESIFGMEGDKTDLLKLVQIASNYNALVYIDEAHATGIMGNNGYGLTSGLFDIYPNLIVMGTFSKALGAGGGYIACSKIIKNYLLNTCSGFIYSTALSPILTEAIYYVWSNLHTEYFSQLRKNLNDVAVYIRKSLQNLDFDIGVSNSHIIPIILKDVEKSQKMYDYLLKNNIKTSHIRPPTVAPNTCRIRLSICANHSMAQASKLIEILEMSKSRAMIINQLN